MAAPRVAAQLNLRNTEVAFQYLSTPQLYRASLLFRAMGSPALVKAGPRMVGAALKLHLPITPLVQHTIYRQFVGGETVEECRQVIDRLAQFDVHTILDYAVEGGQDEAEFAKTYERLQATITASAALPSVPYAVFKITGLCDAALLTKVSVKETLSAAEQQRWGVVEARVLSLCEQAANSGLKIMIDAEETWIQPAIDGLAHQAMCRWNQGKAVVYNTVQMYRADRAEFLRQSANELAKAGVHYGVKLVRGAYMEKERESARRSRRASPIQVDKKATDQAYDDMLAHCIDHIEHMAICAGTHNESSTLLLAELLDQKGIARDDPRVCFSQLLGMSDNLSFNLAHHGYQVAKYVPYGPVVSVLPYLFRRTEENSSIQGQVGRELSMINEELTRRRGQS